MKASIFDDAGILRGQQVGDVNEWLLPRLIAEEWIEGDDDRRAEIDRNLERARRQQYVDQETLFRFL